jgi:hypothetical protein
MNDPAGNTTVSGHQPCGIQGSLQLLDLQQAWSMLRYCVRGDTLMAYTIAAPKPTPVQTINYLATRLLGLLDLASIVESAKIWVGFLREAVELY